MITGTPAVEAGLAELRRKLGDQRVDFGELVILGPRTKARRLPDGEAEAQAGRRELSEWIRRGVGPQVDVTAAEEVKRLGLIDGTG
jgi:hypothetical protein